MVKLFNRRRSYTIAFNVVRLCLGSVFGFPKAFVLSLGMSILFTGCPMGDNPQQGANPAAALVAAPVNLEVTADSGQFFRDNATQCSATGRCAVMATQNASCQSVDLDGLQNSISVSLAQCLNAAQAHCVAPNQFFSYGPRQVQAALLENAPARLAYIDPIRMFSYSTFACVCPQDVPAPPVLVDAQPAEPPPPANIPENAPSVTCYKGYVGSKEEPVQSGQNNLCFLATDTALGNGQKVETYRERRFVSCTDGTKLAECCWALPIKLVQLANGSTVCKYDFEF